LDLEAKNAKERLSILELAKQSGNKSALKFLALKKLNTMRDKVYKAIKWTPV
jgi:hypothetical protein